MLINSKKQPTEVVECLNQEIFEGYTNGVTIQLWRNSNNTYSVVILRGTMQIRKVNFTDIESATIHYNSRVNFIDSGNLRD